MVAMSKGGVQEVHAKEVEPQRKGQQKLGKAAPTKAQVSKVPPLQRTSLSCI